MGIPPRTSNRSSDVSGCVVWLTGLPSSGKSTLAGLLEAELRRRRCAVERLDGDEVRAHLTRDLGFSREDRFENVRRVAYVAHLLARNGVIVIAALVSPYREARDAARAQIGAFLEVYVKASVEACMRRDVKGLYRRALAGEIPNFTGVADPYEPPLDPEVVVETERESPAESLNRILTALTARGYLAPGPADGAELTRTHEHG